MTYSHILFNVADGIATITLKPPRAPATPCRRKCGST